MELSAFLMLPDDEEINPAVDSKRPASEGAGAGPSKKLKTAASKKHKPRRVRPGETSAGEEEEGVDVEKTKASVAESPAPPIIIPEGASSAGGSAMKSSTSFVPPWELIKEDKRVQGKDMIKEFVSCALPPAEKEWLAQQPDEFIEERHSLMAVMAMRYSFEYARRADHRDRESMKVQERLGDTLHDLKDLRESYEAVKTESANQSVELGAALLQAKKYKEDRDFFMKEGFGIFARRLLGSDEMKAAMGRILSKAVQFGEMRGAKKMRDRHLPHLPTSDFKGFFSDTAEAEMNALFKELPNTPFKFIGDLANNPERSVEDFKEFYPAKMVPPSRSNKESTS